MQREDDHEFIGKIPCRIAGPEHLTTAAEVATYKYLEKRTSIPVPSVLSWSSRDVGPVGAEFIVMEKAPGIQLFEEWGNMQEIEKLELIQTLTQLEAQLSSLSFPAYGGLYLKEDANGFPHVNVDAENMFCIGPSPDRFFDTEPLTPPSADKTIDRGPWKTVSELGISIAKQELSRLPKRNLEDRAILHRGTRQEQEDVLKMAISLMPALDSNRTLAKYSKPTLWHTDLHMGNIYISPEKRSQITSFIDLQSVSVLPLFLQARWPVFLQPPRDFKRGLTQPELPADIDTFDENEKAAALQELKQAKVAKAYEVSAFLENRIAHDAMTLPRVFRELFVRLEETSKVGVVPLRECLIEIFQSWSRLDFPGTCPYSFSDEEITAHAAQFAKYQEWSEVQQLAQETLDTDAEGWISPHLNFELKRKQNKDLLSMYVKSVAGQKSEEEARLMWPFPE
ncbi:hypothetical protein BDV06DRAFT_184514 [Aspergillus oleicola]